MQTTFAIPPKSKSDLSPKASGSKSPNQIRKSQTQQSKQINDIARFSGLVDENSLNQSTMSSSTAGGAPNKRASYMARIGIA